MYLPLSCRGPPWSPSTYGAREVGVGLKAASCENRKAHSWPLREVWSVLTHRNVPNTEGAIPLRHLKVLRRSHFHKEEYCRLIREQISLIRFPERWHGLRMWRWPLSLPMPPSSALSIPEPLRATQRSRSLPWEQKLLLRTQVSLSFKTL